MSCTASYGIDAVYGGAGNDWIEGGFSKDAVDGGDGDDTFYVRDGEYGDDTTGGAGIDILNLSKLFVARVERQSGRRDL